MASVSDTLEALSELGLSCLSSEWVDEAWEQNFADPLSLPDGSDGLLSEEKWKSFLYSCRGWVQNKQDRLAAEDEDVVERESFWTVLLDAGLSHKQLMVGAVAVLDGSKKNVKDNLRTVTVAEVYLTLLRIPGSSAFKIFHPLIYRRVVELLTGLCQPEEGGQAPVSRTPKGKRKGRRGKRKLPMEEEDEEDATMEAMEVSDASPMLSGSDAKTVNVRLTELLQSLAVCLCEVSLQSQETSRYHLVSTLTKLLYVDLSRCSTPVPFDTDLRSGTLRSLPVCFLAWLCLKALCQPLHGNRGKLASEIFNQLLPVVLMVTGSGLPVQTVKNAQTLASGHAVAYISHVYNEGGDELEKAFKALVQHMCVKTPDKADYRHKLAKVVSSLLQLTPVKLYSSLVEWVYKFSRNTKVGYRVFALDLVCELLEQPARQCEEGLLSSEEEERLQYKYLIKIILSRCSDKAASVRSRALSALATVASNNLVEGLPKAVHLAVQEQVSPGENGAVENVIYPMLYRRAVDEKVHVRKAAVQAMESLIRLNIDKVQREDVLVLRDRCQDPALLVRKQALSSLTTLTMDYPHCRLLHSFWLDGVLPMIMDRETSAQEKCATLLEEVLLNNITTYKEDMAPHEVFVWDLLHVMSGEGGRELRRYLNRTCQVWGKQKKITPALMKKVRTHAESQHHCEAAWMLLSECVAHTKSIDVDFLSKSWESHVSSVDMEQRGSDLLIGRVMSVARVMAPKLPQALLTKIQGDLQKILQSFSFSPFIITAALETLIVVTGQESGGSKQLQDLCTQLLKECETTLSALLQNAEVSVGNEKLIGYLFTLGEVAQLCPAHTSSHVCYVVQSLLLSSTECEDVKSVLSSQQQQQLTRLDLPAVVRANAYVTLGKLCLQHEEVLRKCLLQMVQELETAQSEAIRNNIVLILCDLIIRYSAKVDSYIPNIAVCLRDDSVLIRRQTLTLLTNLFQEDYIKWKGGLFYRFAVTLVDEDSDLQRYAEFCFSHLLLTKHPGMFFQHFVEGIFHFNCCQKHRVYNRFKQTERELEQFSLKGALHASKRRRLYCFFLENMTDEQRFQVTAKLCQEVLGGVIDGSIALDDDSAPVVKDTLAILASKEIKLKSLHRGLADELAEEGDEEGAAMERARSKLISQIVKKNVIENVVPIVVATKHLFEKTRSPLLRDLMLFLKELMKDYKSEINDVLAADRQLAEEIKFDLKRFEEEQLLANVQRTPAVLTPHAQMISPLLTPGALGSPARAKVPSATPFTPPQLSQRRNKAKFNKEASITVTPMVLGAGKMISGKLQGAPLSRGGDGTPILKRAMGADSSAVVTPRVSAPLKHAPFVTPKAVNTLARAAILASANRAAVLQKTPTKAPIPPELRPSVCPEEETVSNESGIAASDTILVGGERVASTPHDLAQCISFHVSSLAPPSPIMLQLTNEDARLGEGKVPPSKRGKMKAAKADITLKEPAKLQQWNIKA